MNKKYLTLLTLTLGFFSGTMLRASGNGDTETDNMWALTNGQGYGIKITTGGSILPGISGGQDIGSLTQAWGYYVSTAGRMNYGTPTATACAANVTIPYNGAFEYLSSTGNNLVMTATPTISGTGAKNGDILSVTNTSTSTVTLRDRLTLGNSGLILGSASRALGQYDNITFEYFSSSSSWIERSFTNNQ